MVRNVFVFYQDILGVFTSVSIHLKNSLNYNKTITPYYIPNLFVINRGVCSSFPGTNHVAVSRTLTTEAQKV